jgi:ABC-type dipeptide/oligopeptide/nickel transport system permease component
MFRFIVRRVLTMIPILLGVSLVMFVLLRWSPAIRR